MFFFLGRFILHKQELIVQYYGVITDRILDTGVSVRKRVIKILKDICLEFPTYDKIPEICVKMIRRINDEEGIRKLVREILFTFFLIYKKKFLENDTIYSFSCNSQKFREIIVISLDSFLFTFLLFVYNN